MRRFLAAIGMTATFAVLAAGAPPTGDASCAGMASLEQVAGERGTAVFTGRVAGGIDGSQDLVFVVDRWFHGPHAAREIRLIGSTAFLAGKQARGPVEVALAETTSGDAVALALNEPVLMVADWSEEARAFGVRFCTVAGVPLDSAEGRAALAEAEVVFGPGLWRASLPDTSTPAPAVRGVDAGAALLPEWWLPVLALALAASSVLMRRLGMP